MNAPTGNFREDPDYAAGRALCVANKALPVFASAALMRGYLDALAQRQLDGSKANGPGEREPFTTATVPPAKSYGAASRDAAALASLPRTISIFGDDGKLLRPDELKGRYLNLVLDHCGGDRTMTGRLLDAPRRTVQRIAAKRFRRT